MRNAGERHADLLHSLWRHHPPNPVPRTRGRPGRGGPGHRPGPGRGRAQHPRAQHTRAQHRRAQRPRAAQQLAAHHLAGRLRSAARAAGTERTRATAGAPPATGRTLLAVAVVAVLIAAGSAAWMAGSSHPRPGRQPSAATGADLGGSARHPASRPARSPSPRPPTSTVTPIPTSRRGIVSVSRALAPRADAQQVAGFLDSYFAAVNHREYLEYSSLFERWHHLTREQFNRGYRSTHDSSAVLAAPVQQQDRADRDRDVHQSPGPISQPEPRLVHQLADHAVPAPGRRVCT